MGDRAYGTVDLISMCHELGWDYRLRIKGNILTYQEIEPKHAGSLAPRMYANVPITSQGIHTNRGTLKPGSLP